MKSVSASSVMASLPRLAGSCGGVEESKPLIMGLQRETGQELLGVVFTAPGRPKRSRRRPLG